MYYTCYILQSPVKASYKVATKKVVPQPVYQQSLITSENVKVKNNQNHNVKPKSILYKEIRITSSCGEPFSRRDF